MQDLIENSKHFCVLPWIHLHAWPNKNVMPCCVADTSMPVSKITDEDTILDIMNSDEYKKMRLAMLNDAPYEACRRCYDLEENGTWTLRQSQNAVRGMDNIDLIEATNIDGSIDEFRMKYMDIRFSNLCNFKCRSCGPECSNLWAEERLKLASADAWIHSGGRETLITSNAGGRFMDKLKPYLRDVEECYFAGGEILIHPEHYECLDYWIKHDLAKNVKLNYTTNMSKIKYGDRNLFELWKHFSDIEVWASIDAIGEMGEVIRKGFNWNKIQKNLFAVKEHSPDIKLHITPTVSIWNIFDYLEMFNWMVDNEFITPTRPPRVNILTYPTHAQIGNLPDHIRTELIAQIRLLVDKKFNTPDWHDVRNGLLLIINTLESGRENREQLIEFFIENEIIDGVRNEIFETMHPKIQEVREWTEN